MDEQTLWYAFHLGRDGSGPHAGFEMVKTWRDDIGNRYCEHLVNFSGEHEGKEVRHNASCSFKLSRNGGRPIPVSIEYRDDSSDAKLVFDSGTLKASGTATENDGEPYPDDAMPGYAVQHLAATIATVEGASINYTPVTEGNGKIDAPGSRLVNEGKTDKLLFPSKSKLWRVTDYTPDETPRSSFYFDDEGVLQQVDWNGACSRLAASEEEAKPVLDEIPLE